ncbi:PrsW family intramembrane metalloprotease [Halospeciosus flavus]|uniref:PrsW family intramembrane metalloprotease n=1 Tax=Halospeciosus flavus TaxID=3032283 RepID=A0ABD5Z634_9EURY|nr:PrsW family intramembrane metalloprotease [Halospeciosus flavus]
MDEKRDPIQKVAGEGQDLYDVATWDERTGLDRFSTSLYGVLKTSARWFVVLLAFVILAAQFLLTGLATVKNPILGVYVLLSVVPALGLAIYVWKVDVTMKEPLPLLVVTFVLGILFAGFAAIVNTIMQGFFTYIPVVGMVLFFFLVVGPIEETVKWAAIRLYAFRSDKFDAVVDGAVYGAVAGLGFATIENTIYIARPYLQAAAAGGATDPLQVALQTALVRGFAGPGHVIYSAFAGYYLGLAKFNPENRGPIVVKGLVIAVFIHGLYNSVVSNLGTLTAFLGLGGVSYGIVFIGFVIVYDGTFLYILYRKLARYRKTFRDLGAHEAYEGETTLEEDAVDEGDADPTVADEPIEVVERVDDEKNQ